MISRRHFLAIDRPLRGPTCGLHSFGHGHDRIHAGGAVQGLRIEPLGDGLAPGRRRSQVQVLTVSAKPLRRLGVEGPGARAPAAGRAAGDAPFASRRSWPTRRGRLSGRWAIRCSLRLLRLAIARINGGRRGLEGLSSASSLGKAWRRVRLTLLAGHHLRPSVRLSIHVVPRRLTTLAWTVTTPGDSLGLLAELASLPGALAGCGPSSSRLAQGAREGARAG